MCPVHQCKPQAESSQLRQGIHGESRVAGIDVLFSRFIATSSYPFERGGTGDRGIWRYHRQQIPAQVPRSVEKLRTLDKTRYLSIFCAEQEQAPSGEGGREGRRTLDYRETRCPIRENQLTPLLGWYDAMETTLIKSPVGMLFRETLC